ncbi:MAG: glutamate-5-semialdehyde dehydrogenase, partial [Candidatus Bathyarchaeia archaeon]
MSSVREKAQAAKSASYKMLTLTTKQKNDALEAMARQIWMERERILEANEEDIVNARMDRLSKPLLKRLMLDEKKLYSVVEMVKSVSFLEDPVGVTQYAVELDKGMSLFRVTTPIGVIGAIFESRPDVLPQIASLCLKSGNAVIMKGGHEASNSNQTLYRITLESTIKAGIPDGWIQLLDVRSEVDELLKLSEYVDLIVPRGSNSLVKYIQENTRIPVLGHSEGVCQIYVDEKANLEKAVKICFDAKVQYPAVCNAVDTLLVHKNVAEEFLPLIAERYKHAGVEIRGDNEVCRILGGLAKRAINSDWGHEYLDLIVAIKVVENLEEAVQYINTYGSHHTDSIITEDVRAAIAFLERVDSASVFWNVSTRFSDGYRYGLGAEVGISTGKIHARGPTGLEGLTTYKYYLVGSGQVVKDYVDGSKK